MRARRLLVGALIALAGLPAAAQAQVVILDINDLGGRWDGRFTGATVVSPPPSYFDVDTNGTFSYRLRQDPDARQYGTSRQTTFAIPYTTDRDGNGIQEVPNGRAQYVDGDDLFSVVRSPDEPDSFVVMKLDFQGGNRYSGTFTGRYVTCGPAALRPHDGTGDKNRAYWEGNITIYRDDPNPGGPTTPVPPAPPSSTEEYGPLGTIGGESPLCGTARQSPVLFETSPPPGDANPYPVPGRATATQPRCNRGPNPGDPFTCTATVGDAATDGTPSAPAGLVRFTATEGSFSGPDTCTLTSSPSTPSTSSCSVTYVNAGAAAGTSLPLRADYSGSSVHATSGAAHDIDAPENPPPGATPTPVPGSGTPGSPGGPSGVPGTGLTADGRQATGASAICNRGPNPGDDSTCSVLVGDASPSGAVAPAGTVRFTAAAGTFRGGNSCVLRPTPTTPSVSGCSVTYVPVGNAEFPDLTATYPGNSVHGPSTARTRLITGPIFGLDDQTVVGPGTCAATVGAATSSGARAFAPRYQRDHPNPLRNPVAGPGDYIAYCATNLWYQGKGAVYRVGQIGGTGLGVIMVPGGVVVAIVAPEPLSKGAGVAAVAGGPLVAYESIVIGDNLITANDTAIADPPDPRFTVPAKAVERRKVRVRGSSATARALNRLLAVQARVRALSTAFTSSLDKAGGARIAGSSKYVGVNTRAAIGFARRLAVALDDLQTATRRAAPLMRRVRGMTKRVTRKQVVALRPRIRRALPRKLDRALRAMGWTAAERARMRRLASSAAPAGSPAPPTSLAAVVADPVMLRLYRDTALGMRYFTVHPQVLADAAL